MEYKWTETYKFSTESMKEVKQRFLESRIGKHKRSANTCWSTNSEVVILSLISSYAQHGLSDEAFYCFRRMKDDGLSPDAVIFICILKICVTARNCVYMQQEDVCRQMGLPNYSVEPMCFRLSQLNVIFLIHIAYCV